MLPFVLAAQLARSHGKVFISHQLQGGSQTRVKETFSSRQVSADHINSARACTWVSLSLSLSSLELQDQEKNIEILRMKVAFIVNKGAPY